MAAGTKAPALPVKHNPRIVYHVCVFSVPVGHSTRISRELGFLFTFSLQEFPILLEPVGSLPYFKKIPVIGPPS
jgi:hypothetical protein